LSGGVGHFFPCFAQRRNRRFVTFSAFVRLIRRTDLQRENAGENVRICKILLVAFVPAFAGGNLHPNSKLDYTS
jgi:hypothetical protein